MRQSVKLLAGFSSAVVAGAGLLYRWTNSVSEAIDPTIQLSRETNEAVETIQALGYAASVNGSSLDAVSSSLSEMNKRFGEFVRTGGGPAAEVAIQLGLNLRKSNGEVKKASDVMLELNGKLSRFSRAEQTDILDKLGINPSMIQLLTQSDSAISSLMQKAMDLGVVNKEQADQLAAYNDANTTLRFGLKSLQNQIAVGLTPALMDLVDGFTNWLASNKDLIQNISTGFGKAIVTREVERALAAPGTRRPVAVPLRAEAAVPRDGRRGGSPPRLRAFGRPPRPDAVLRVEPPAPPAW